MTSPLRACREVVKVRASVTHVEQQDP